MKNYLTILVCILLTGAMALAQPARVMAAGRVVVDQVVAAGLQVDRTVAAADHAAGRAVDRA